jgi:hypothetical protein
MPRAVAIYCPPSAHGLDGTHGSGSSSSSSSSSSCDTEGQAAAREPHGADGDQEERDARQMPPCPPRALQRRRRAHPAFACSGEGAVHHLF